MQLRAKITFFSGLIAAILILFLAGASLLSFRQFAIQMAEDHNNTLAEIIRTNLTDSMINGVIDKREKLLERISQVEGLISARVIRSQHVSDQFGRGLGMEQPADSIDMQVIDSQTPYFAIEKDGLTPVFRSTIPFTATSSGDPNCLQCHHVPAGTVLGAVTLTTSSTALMDSVLRTVLILVGSVTLFASGSVVFLNRLVRPLVHTAADVQKAVGKAVAGDFSVRIDIARNDEIGQIANDINHLFSSLNDSFEHMQSDVAELIKARPESGENLLDDTINMVEGLIEAAHFKQAIEEDETTAEVYCRLCRLLLEEFGLTHFSLYEVNREKNQMQTVNVDGEEQGRCHWCDPDILVRSEACRARRTGHIIDSTENPTICNAFRGESPDLRHICIPVIQSGSVGSVVQVVEDEVRMDQVKARLAYLQVYLREASPVIQGKRLMDTLRDSTLHDPMTGLHNRRFLEEYVSILVADAQRNNGKFSILMADLDFFKRVNDELGHDAGDEVLKALAKCLVGTVRASDLVVRYGGEEFLMILKNTEKEPGALVGEKIRAAVEQMKVQVGGNTLKKTLSLGVAAYPEDSRNFWQIVKFADVALYKAKESGRNRVVSFTADMWNEDEHY